MVATGKVRVTITAILVLCLAHVQAADLERRLPAPVTKARTEIRIPTLGTWPRLFQVRSDM